MKFTDLFKRLQKNGGVAEDEMLRTFNCGLGMIVVCEQKNKAAVIEAIQKSGEKAFDIGKNTEVVKYI